MSLSHGDIEVQLGDETYSLRPTLKAMKKIQSRFGGVRGAMDALTQLNSEHIAAIIAAGTDALPRDVPAIEEAVFQQGITSATEQVVAYVVALMNPSGDKEPDAESAKEKK